MPPKKNTTTKANPELNLTAPNVAVLRAALMNLKSFECDWEAVRSEIQIKNKKHAPRDFGKAIAKLDLVLRNGKIFSTATDGDNNNDGDDDNDDKEDEGEAAADTKAAAAKTAKGTKRKAGQDDQEGAVAKKQAKKDSAAGSKKKVEFEEPADKDDDA